MLKNICQVFAIISTTEQQGVVHGLRDDTKVIADHLQITDGLETLIIYSAAFAAGFMEIVLFFQKWSIAPFRARFLDMIKLKLTGSMLTFCMSVKS